MPAKAKSAKIAVILVDMQDFFLKRISPSTKKDLITNQSKIIKVCSSRHIPLIVLEYEGTGRGKTISALQKELNRAMPIVIRKPHNSGFRDTDLASTLEELRVKKVVLMGINGSGCVQDTAMGALARGYAIATGRGVIATASKRDMNLATSKRWFLSNGEFFEEPSSLLAYIQRHFA